MIRNIIIVCLACVFASVVAFIFVERAPDAFARFFHSGLGRPEKQRHR